MPKLHKCQSAVREREATTVLKIQKEACKEEGGGCLEGEGVVVATTVVCLQCKAASLLLFVSEAPLSPPGVKVTMLLFMSEAPSPPGVKVTITASPKSWHP
jgi:hypothetical protein